MGESVHVDFNHCYFPLQAYRLEPLILKHYATIAPLTIQRHDLGKKVPYNQMKTTAYAAFDSSGEKEKTDKGDPSDEMKQADTAPPDGGRDVSPARASNQGLTSMCAYQ